MSLAPYIRIIARGQGRARAMTMTEAQEAMCLMLKGRAAPEAVGALLMVLRLRGETAVEIAGFTAALRSLPRQQVPRADLDWPAYAAGRTRGAPLFVLAARLVMQAGYRVHMHGWNGSGALTGAVRRVADASGNGVTYSPLETLHPDAFRLLRLRDSFGLRSCLNTVLRMWNPSGAPAGLQGVFHPSYRGLQTEAALMLGQRDLGVIKGGGGEFERHPAKAITIFGLRNGNRIDQSVPALLNDVRRLHDANALVDAEALWSGAQRDTFAEATVTGTAAVALWILKAADTLPETQKMAEALWQSRSPTERLIA